MKKNNKKISNESEYVAKCIFDKTVKGKKVKYEKYYAEKRIDQPELEMFRYETHYELVNNINKASYFIDKDALKYTLKQNEYILQKIIREQVEDAGKYVVTIVAVKVQTIIQCKDDSEIMEYSHEEEGYHKLKVY